MIAPKDQCRFVNADDGRIAAALIEPADVLAELRPFFTDMIPDHETRDIVGTVCCSITEKYCWRIIQLNM